MYHFKADLSEWKRLIVISSMFSVEANAFVLSVMPATSETSKDTFRNYATDRSSLSTQYVYPHLDLPSVNHSE
jgi:hypothetical protein